MDCSWLLYVDFSLFERLEMSRFSVFSVLLSVCFVLVMFVFVAPVLGLAISSSTDLLSDVIYDAQVHLSVRLTLQTAFISTFILSFFAIPFSYLLARREFFGKNIVLAIIDFPILIPHTAAGIAVLSVISRETLAGQIAEQAGINLQDAPIGISVAMAFSSLPFMINTVKSGFEQIPYKYEKAAYSLGASMSRVFFTIALPLSWKNIVAGYFLMFTRGIGEFGVVAIVAFHPMITSSLIYERFLNEGILSSQPLAFVVMALSLVFFIVVRIFLKKQSYLSFWK